MTSDFCDSDICCLVAKLCCFCINWAYLNCDYCAQFETNRNCDINQQVCWLNRIGHSGRVTCWLGCCEQAWNISLYSCKTVILWHRILVQSAQWGCKSGAYASLCVRSSSFPSKVLKSVRKERRSLAAIKASAGIPFVWYPELPEAHNL